MKAIEAGLLSVDCLKASQASVHAVRRAFGRDQIDLKNALLGSAF
jgi:hypothetical protein